MTNTGQIVAALAAGALLTIACMVVVKLYRIERRAEERRRIDTAVQAILGGVETFRQEWPGAGSGHQDTEALNTAVEVHARAHLRLIKMRPGRPSSRRLRAPGENRPASVRRR